MLICILFYINTAVFAEEELPTFEVSLTADSIDVNESVYVLLDLKNNCGFGALQFRIDYDAKKLLLDEVTTGEIIPNSAITSVNTDVVGEINFSAISLQDITESGTLLVSKFTAKQSGTSMLDLKMLAFADSAGTSLDATLTDSQITVKSENPTTSSGGGSHNSGGSTSRKNDKSEEPAEPKIDEAEKPKQTYTDVPDTHWAREYIEKAFEIGIVSGYENGEFKPDNEMTRAEFTTLLWNVAEKPETSAKLKFTDVSEKDWFYKQVAWGFNEGIISGTSETTFSPTDKLTREQAMTILYRYSGSPETENVLDKFIDSVDVSEYAKNAMNWAVSNDIIFGINETELSPETSATRAQLATIIVRFLNK